jgi:hypothetical protein
VILHDLFTVIWNLIIYIFYLTEWIQQSVAISAVTAQSTRRCRSSNTRGCAKELVQIANAVTRKLVAMLKVK